MSVLGVVLESAALAAALSTVTALVSLVVLAMSSRTAPTLRADIAFLAALAPALVVVVALSAALSPSLLTSLGFAVSDHCPSHSHHPHLCVLHFEGLRPSAAVLGAATLAFFAVRLMLVAGRHLRMAQTVRNLEALGTSSGATEFPVVEVPGVARLCHAVGIVRRRILVSERVRGGLSERAWDAVRAHEDEHLRRRDPLAVVLVELGLAIVPPVLSGALGATFRRSVETACDAAAAQRLGGGIEVAEGLLEAARLMGSAPANAALTAPAATEDALEERVRELLDVRATTSRRSIAFPAAAGLVFGLVLVASFHAPVVHHALETLLFYVT